MAHSANPEENVLFGPDRITKEGQENFLTVALADLYKRDHGVVLLVEQAPPNPEPPDRIFRYGAIRIGVEMTEVDQDYQLRGRKRDLTNIIYKEFCEAELGDRYEGISIDLGGTQDTIMALSGPAMRAVARDLVRLIVAELPSTAPLRSIISRLIPVDRSLYGNLHQLTSHISVMFGPANDIRRTDGRAAPLIVPGSGRIIDEGAIIAKLMTSLRKKAEDKNRVSPPTSWSTICHSILLFHDHPRGRIYHGIGSMGYLFEGCLRTAVLQSSQDAAQFNEIIFLTFRTMSLELIRIHGAPLIASL